jgi:dipeptidyl-peptidase-3
MTSAGVVQQRAGEDQLRLIHRVAVIAVSFCLAGCRGNGGAAAEHAKEHSSLVERVGSTGFVQLEADSFNHLTPRQQALAYWLSQAAIATDPIIYDQLSRFGLREKRLLDALVSHPQGVKPEVMSKILAFTKLFWANKGNHNDLTAQKFLPEFTFEEFEQAGEDAMRSGLRIDDPYGTGRRIHTGAEFAAETKDLKPALFDPAFEPMMTAKSPEGGVDILLASSNNLYSGVSMADVKGFHERYRLNSQLVKVSGRLEERVYRAGTPDGRIPPGLYARFLKEAIEKLQKASSYAEPGQDTAIGNLIRFYESGDPEDWLRFGASWVQNNAAVDFDSGFIEVYRDARGAKGTSQSFVAVTDQRVNSLMTKIAASAQYFEDRAPWDAKYKKQGVKPPLAKAVESVIETGDFSVLTVGDNLPNEDELHQKYGTKSFMFTGSARALSHAAGNASIEEFGYSREEIERAKKYGDEAEDLLTALHEIVGHGSGKLSAKLTQDASFYLKEYSSTLEEARADLMALWNVFDPKLAELGVISSPEVAKAMYDASARVALVQLRRIPRGDSLEEDHDRDRQLIVNYIIDKTKAIEGKERNGKSYITVRDYGRMRQGVGMLLAELMRIKAEGDYAAIKTLADKYGVHLDPAVRDEVVARYANLNLPIYWAGVNPSLDAKFGAGGQVESVSISYPRDYARQQLEYTVMYEKRAANRRE